MARSCGDVGARQDGVGVLGERPGRRRGGRVPHGVFVAAVVVGGVEEVEDPVPLPDEGCLDELALPREVLSQRRFG